MKAWLLWVDASELLGAIIRLIGIPIIFLRDEMLLDGGDSSYGSAPGCRDWTE